VRALCDAVCTVEVAPSLAGYLVDLAAATRRHPDVELGASPRATLALQRAVRALAAASGRGFAIPDDVKALAQPVLAHRLLLEPEAQVQGATAADVVQDILATLPVPTGVHPV
jgi:MoxR-like ATPase